MRDKITNSLKDALDVLKHVRSARAVARLLLPASMTAPRVLNRGGVVATTIEDARELAQELRELRNRLETEAIDDRGRVDYRRLRGSETQAALERTSQSLRGVRADELDGDAERVAFWINLYNVLTMHGVLALEIDASVMENPAFFASIAYDVGGHSFTPDEIENGVLRCNARHPVSNKRLFGRTDPRRACCPSRVDPRIHAALVCAAKSCPPVRFYEPEHLQQQLDVATRHYVAAEVEVAPGLIRLPITFRYYAEDFTEPDGIRQFILEHAEGEHGEALREAFAGDARIEYARYDWALNHA